MIDRERLLAADHEAQLRAEARSRRAAMEAGHGRAESRSLRVRARLTVGQWLVNTGRRLDAGNDPCGPAEVRPV
jgi:hypothetical protein